MNAITPVTPARTRQRPNPAATATGGMDWMKRGSVARAVTEQELERQQQRAEERARQRQMPFRYWLRVGEEQGNLIILDHELGPAFYEHELENKATGKFDIHEACPKEWEACPLCEGVAGGKPSNYMMFFTVIDMREYTTRNGVTFPFTRKLLAIKPQLHGFFHRLSDRLGGNLRGVHLLMTRDAKTTPNTGIPEFHAQYDEAALISSFGNEEQRDNSGKVIKARNADLEVIPYAELFARPSAEDLRRRYGGTAPIGSRSANQGDDDGWGGHDPARAGGSTIQRAARTSTAPASSALNTDSSGELDDEIPF